MTDTPTKRPIILPGEVEIRGNVNMNGKELQNVNLQNLTTAPRNATEGRVFMDSVNHEPKYHDGTEFKSFGKIYEFSTGLTENNGTVVVTDYAKLMKNTATANNALTLLGLSASENGVNIGVGSASNTDAVAYGYNAVANAQNAVSIGSGATTTSRSAIQIGYGSNSDEATLKVGFYWAGISQDGIKNWELLNGKTGLIPDARLSSNIARTSDIPTVPTKLSDFTDDLGSSPTHTHSQYLNSSLKGANNGLAELDANGKIPTSQIPGSIDEVIDSYIVSGATALSSGWLSKTSGGSALTPETDVIYVILSSGTYQNKTYRWSGSTYVEISASPGQATESSAGIAEIATTAEVTAGTDDTRIVTPSKLAGALSNYASKIKTLTNTTFNANGTGNSISNLEVEDFASGVVRTQSDGIRDVSNASDSAFATEKAIADAIRNFITGISSSDVTNALGFTPVKKYATNNPTITVFNNYGTWTINTGIPSSDLNVNFYEITNDGNSVMYPSYNVDNGVITAWIYSSSNISADSLRVVVTG